MSPSYERGRPRAGGRDGASLADATAVGAREAGASARGQAEELRRARSREPRAGRVAQHAGLGRPEAEAPAVISRAFGPDAQARREAPGTADQRFAPAARPFPPALAAEVRGAMASWLAADVALARATKARPRLPMARFEGPARAAKQVVDAVFGAYASSAVLTSKQAEARARPMRATGDDPRLRDMTAPVLGAGGDEAWDGRGLAWWIARNAPGVAQALARHGLALDDLETAARLQEVVSTFAAEHPRELELVHRYRFASADPERGDLFLNPHLPAGGGSPEARERAALWGAFRSLVHEYLHTLEHPAFRERVPQPLREGFCEMFERQVLEEVLPRAADDAALRALVEGADLGPADPAVVGRYQPGDYADELARAEAIRDAIGGAQGERAARAAFFQGHVESLGLEAEAEGEPARPAVPGAVRPPPGADLAELAALTGVSEAEIRAANPGLAGPLPAFVRVPGARMHRVVAAVDEDELRAEALAHLAAQTGVAPDRLVAANPAVDLDALNEGDEILVPAR